MAAKKTADYGIVHCLCRFPAPCSTHCKEQLFNIIMSQLLSLFKNIDDRNLRTRLIRTFLPSKRREPSSGWKNIAFPWYGSDFSSLAPPSGNLTPPRISPSCPHCLSLWLDSEYRSTVSSRDSLPKLLWAGWVPLGHLSRPSFMQSSPHRWVLAHPPHRCSPSSGAR